MSLIWTFYSIAYDSLLTFRPYRNLVKDLVVKSSLQKGDKVIDLGVGTGNFEKIAGRKDVEYFCFDFSNAMLSRAKKKNPACKYKKYDLTKYEIPIQDSFADKVVSCNVVYNLDNLDLFFKDVIRVLKPGGRFIFTTSVNSGLLPIIKVALIPFEMRSFLKMMLWLPAFIYVLFINIIIDRSAKYYFYSKKDIMNSLNRSGFRIISSVASYAGQNVTIVVEK